MPQPQKIVIVGAGPVGCLAAIYAAQRGDIVEIYELRADARDSDSSTSTLGVSINLSIAERGINALNRSRRDGLTQKVMRETIPMRGRMIHGRDQDEKLWERFARYDNRGRHLNAVDRRFLNSTLLGEIDELPNVHVFFQHRLTSVDFTSKKAWFEVKSSSARAESINDHIQTRKELVEVEADFDLLIGADGAHSAVRRHLMKHTLMDYHQQYINALWCEFRIDPTDQGEYAMDPYCLHIWPDGQHMFIAVPTEDKSFVCTLFAPPSFYTSHAKSCHTLIQSFDRHFPGLCPQLISPQALVDQFSTHPHLPMISVRCSSYHLHGSAVILGDAAHAMVPFYAQGLNSGLEDVCLLFDMLEKHSIYSDDLPEDAHELRARALAAFSLQRRPDAFAICELSLQNYHDMSKGLKPLVERMRKRVEEALDKHVPWLGWGPEYSRVSFSTLPYSQVIRETSRQGFWLSLAMYLASIVVAFAACLLFTVDSVEK